MEKILITPRSFGKTDRSVFEMIKSAGFEPKVNPYGKILTKEQMCEEIADAAGVIIGVDPLDGDVLSHAEHLRAVAKYGVGTDNIDKEYCERHKIPVSITRGANANAVADYAFALIMALARKLPYINGRCHEKKWDKVIGSDVYGKTIGILGLGAIGKGVAKRASGFSMNVLAYDVFWNDDYAKENHIAYAKPEEIFERADFISLHLPLTDETRHIIDAEAISRMKDGAFLVNTARGDLIEENALIEALKSGKLGGAGLDVFNEEPPANEAYYHLDNLIMGSHCAASTVGASESMSRMAAENILRDLRG